MSGLREKERPRVFFLIYSLRGGGAERITVELAKSLHRRGFDVVIGTLESTEAPFYDLGGDLTWLPIGLASRSGSLPAAIVANVRRLMGVRRAIRSSRADIVVAMMSTSAILLALASIGLNIRKIGCERNFPEFSLAGRAWRLLRRHAYSRLEVVTAQTEEGAQWLRTNTRARRVEVLPNAVTWPLPETDPIVEPSAVLPPGKNLLLAVGRLHPQKNFQDLIRAFAVAAESRADWVLAILGEGGEHDLLEGLIREKRLQGRVFIPGRVGNVGTWYKHAQIFALSSKYEGFPNVLVEAMAHGCAAISFDCPTGPGEIIENEANGLLVPRDDFEMFSRQLERLMNDEALRGRLSAAASGVRDTFSEDVIVARWIELLREGARRGSSLSRQPVLQVVR